MYAENIRPPALADTGQESPITECFIANEIIRAGWNGQQWNVYARGDRFVTGDTIEEAIDKLGGWA